MITTKIFVDARSANASVKIRIGKDRKAAYIPLSSVVIKPYQWDGKSVVSHPSAALYNAIIAEAKAKIDKAIFLLGDSLELKDVWKSPVCVTPEAQVPLTLESKFRMTPIKS